MINGQSVLAVIPARGGSKRAPQKNMKPYKGKWLLGWTVEAARGSKYIDDLVLSSEDERLLEQGRKLGVTTLERPMWLATDRAMNEGVLVHTLYTHKWADWVVLLQPTSPNRIADDIDICIERAQTGAGCVSYSEHGRRNGAVYVARSTELVAGVQFSQEIDRNFYIMPNARSLDIDYMADFEQ